MDIVEDTVGLGPQPDNVQGDTEAKSHLSEQADSLMNGNAHAESKHADPTTADGLENESAEVNQECTVEENGQLLDLTPELQEGLKILNYFLADKKLTEPFRDEVFNHLSESDTQKYRREIQEPMCLNRMNEKFHKGEYDSITQVVNDFRLMIYNCQRFNGLNHPLSKKANKINIVLKQKLNLLRSDFRSKIAQDSTKPWSGKQDNQDGCLGTGLRKRTANHRLDDASAMLTHLRMKEEQKAKEERRLKKEEHRAAQAAAERELIDWEEEHVTGDPVKSCIQHSWELPQVGLFLFLCRDALQLEEVPMYELERCLAMPRQSKRLQQIMTALLSTPYQREKRAEKSMPDMPYSVWTRKLSEMMDSWYKVLDSCHGNIFSAVCKLGLVEKSFKVLGLKNPLREKLFHNLSFYKRVWILKSVCDHLVEKEEHLRSVIEAQDPNDQRSILLGTDRHGNQYIHFVQFCGPNLRIYRQKKPPVPVVKEVEEEEEDADEDERRRKPVKGKRGAKRKLNLDGPHNAKRSGSATPLNGSETDGTVSPAPSDTRAKSRASSSRHSSPLPREANGRSRQTSARNSPAPDSSVDSFSMNIAAWKGRKTRNSAESTLFANMDLEAYLREQRSRRGRGAKNVSKEIGDAESVSTIGDESSQDGLRADTPSSAIALDGDVKTDMELVNGKLSTGVEGPLWPPSEIKSESQDSSDVDSVKKAGHFTHSNVYSFGTKTEASDGTRIKLEPDSEKCDKDLDVRQDGAECDKPAQSCDIKHDIKKEDNVPMDTTPANGVSATNGSNPKSPVTCDTNSRSAASGNPSSNQLSTPSSPHPPFPSAGKTANQSSLRKDGSADDSGFVSFQTSPRTASASTACITGIYQHIPGSVAKAGSVSAGKGFDSIKEEKEEEGASVKVEDAHEQNKDSEGGSQSGADADQKQDQDSGSQGPSNALLDHADYSEEEMVPDPAEFELIVEDMDGLDRLVKQFDPNQVELSPQISPGARAGKRQKSRSTPKAVRQWACELELHQRLVRMQGELQQFRSKLASLTKKARLKLQREYLNFTEEVPKVEDLQAWDSESDSEQNTDESGVEGSQSGKESDDSEDVSNETLSAASKLKVPSKASSTGSVESSEVDQRDIEEYEQDVSSRGRLRKRRLIPNNVEDQGVKKKKVVKKPEDSTPITTASQVSNLICRSEDGTIRLNISNSEFLAMVEQGGPAASELVQQLAAAKSPSGQTLGWKPQGIKVIGGPVPHGTGEGAPKAGTTQSSAHPVMQRILSTQSAGGLRPVTGFTVQRKKAEVTPASSTPASTGVTLPAAAPSSGLSMSRAAGPAGLNLHSPLLMTASTKGGKQQVFVVTPEQQEELFRSGILRRQEVRKAPGVVRPQVVIGNTTTTSSSTGTSSSAVPSTSHTATATMHLTAVRQVTPPGHPSPHLQPGVLAATNTPRPAHNVLHGQGQGPAAPAKVQGGTGAVTAVKIVPSSNGNGQEMVGVPVVVGQVVPQVPQVKKPPVIINNASGSRTLVLQSGKALPRYAGNVTVKELLESRAASKAEDSDSSSTSDSTSSGGQPHGRIVVSADPVPVTTPLSIVTTTRAGQKTATVQRAAPGVVRFPSQSSLDDALQTVVTGYSTTLPTADIKVPSPTTLPSLSPRKSLTRIVSSTKAPIPTFTKVQAKNHPMVLASNFVPGSNAVVAGSRVVPGLMPAGTVVRPGTVVLPTGQTVGSREPVVVQVIPRGAAGVGNVAQRYILPQAGSIVHLANARTPTAAAPSGQDSSALPLTHSQNQSPAPTTSSIVDAGPSVGGVQQSGSQSLLMTVPSPSAGALSSKAEGSSPSAAITKNTSEVLKSMLAAKAVALTNTVTTTSCSTTATVLTPASSSPGGVQVSTQPGAFLSQHSVAQLTQMPRVIRAPVSRVQPVAAGSHPAAVVQQRGPRMMQAPAPVGLQLQNLAVAGLQPASVTGNPALPDAQRTGIVRMQLAGVQPGGTALRLVASGQPGSGSAGGLPPVLATIKQGQAGLQQLQFLAAAGGLPLGVQSQQQLTVRPVSGSGQGSGGQAVSIVGQHEEQKPTVQLCFAMQQGTQGVMNSTTSSVVPQTVVQGAGLRAAAPAVQGGFPVLGSPPVSPCNSGTVSKVIMANPATTLPISASLQSIPTCSMVNQTSVTSLNSADNRLIMSISPGSLKSQFIVSPVSSQSFSEAGHPALTQQSVPLQTTCTDSRNGQTLSTPSTSQLQSTVKRRLSASDLQPIPAKKACLDTGAASTSGAMLASLSQMIGSTKVTSASGDAAGTPSTRDPANSGVQRVVIASSSGDNSASCTLLNLAAHVSTGSALPMAVSATLPSVQAASVSAPLLQQLGGLAPVVGRAQPAAPQKQVVAVRNIGGQLLTDNNIPVTENNGEYKVLPKATIQIGSQTVTVLSPSSAMIHNVRNPASASIIPAVTHSQTPTSAAPSTVSVLPPTPAPTAGVVKAVVQAAPSQSQGIVRAILRPDIKPEMLLSVYPQAVLNPSSQGTQPERTDAQDSAAGVTSVAPLPIHLEAPVMTPTVSRSSTPLLKARLEQPRLGQSGSSASVPVPRETPNGAAISEGLTLSAESGSAQNSSQASSGGGRDAAGGGVNSDNQNNVEEEAALNLLSLANQMM